jgi:hypothetical protein
MLLVLLLLLRKFKQDKRLNISKKDVVVVVCIKWRRKGMGITRWIIYNAYDALGDGSGENGAKKGVPVSYFDDGGMPLTMQQLKQKYPTTMTSIPFIYDPQKSPWVGIL